MCGECIIQLVLFFHCGVLYSSTLIVLANCRQLDINPWYEELIVAFDPTEQVIL